MTVDATTERELSSRRQSHAAFLRGVLRSIALEPLDSYADPAVCEATQDLIDWFQDRLAMVTDELAAHIVDQLEHFPPEGELVQISVAELAASRQLPPDAIGVRWPLHDECTHHAAEALARTLTLFEPGVLGVVLFPRDGHLDCIDCIRQARASGEVTAP